MSINWAYGPSTCPVCGQPFSTGGGCTCWSRGIGSGASSVDWTMPPMDAIDIHAEEEKRLIKAWRECRYTDLLEMIAERQRTYAYNTNPYTLRED